MTDHKPQVPLKMLVQHTCDDGADYDDGLMGYSSAILDGDMLVLTFEPDAADDPDFSEYARTVYRFKFVGEGE